jgi:hypothetical protein
MKDTHRTVSLFSILVHCSVAQFIVKGAIFVDDVEEYIVFFKNLIKQYCNFPEAEFTNVQLS